MIKISNRDLRELARLALKQGWQVKYTGGSHLKWIPPHGEFIITSSTPDTKHSFTNAKQSLERAGLITNAAVLKAVQTKPDTQKEQEMPDPFCCRNDGCPQRFETQFSRDRHEEELCLRRVKIKRRKAKLGDPDAKECPVCSKAVTAKNLPAHVRRHEGWDWAPGRRGSGGYAFSRALGDSGNAPPTSLSTTASTRPATTDNEALIALMVEAVFPDGLPIHRGEVLRALADWSEQTEVFLDAVRGETS